ncbi:Epidermal growth factor receptor kinase substrate 8 [Dirofilaria immitis]|nr:Epidermal growth factor receptor kinase substrate 8 [Dirofilaria immitis]
MEWYERRADDGIIILVAFTWDYSRRIETAANVQIQNLYTYGKDIRRQLAQSLTAEESIALDIGKKTCCSEKTLYCAEISCSMLLHLTMLVLLKWRDAKAPLKMVTAMMIRAERTLRESSTVKPCQTLTKPSLRLLMWKTCFRKKTKTHALCLHPPSFVSTLQCEWLSDQFTASISIWFRFILLFTWWGSLSSNAPSPAVLPYNNSVSPQQYNGVIENSTMSVHGSSRHPSAVETDTPSYWVEHLATFAVGREFGLQYPEDGVRKLKQLENSSAIWAQPMVLRLRPNVVSVEDENGDLVEQFPMELVTNPTAHLSTNPATTGRRDTGFMIGYQPPFMMGPPPRCYRDDTSASSDSSESFERDVNTLNRCFDDIERFVARIQSAAIAQRELETQTHRQRTHRKQNSRTPIDPQSGILQMRAQLPAEFEFVDILQKFKLSFNLLAKLKNHIHEPNAPELLHFLFTPLTIILDACRWGLGKNVAPQVVSPLLSRETRELLQNCLTSRESDVEDWIGPLPKPYRPIFLDGFAPYGYPDNYGGPRSPSRYQSMPQPIHRGMSAPPPPTQNSYTHRPPIRDHSVDNLNMDLDHMSLEKERLDFEREKIAERERRLIEDERRILQEKQRLAAEKEMMAQEAEQRSVGSSYTPRQNETSHHPSPVMPRRPLYQSQFNDSEQQQPVVPTFGLISQEQNDIIARHAKLVQVTHTRIAQNPKELTVSQGEFLEVLNDNKNWWECTNVHHRVGYVPHTILSVDRMSSQGNAVQHRGTSLSLSPHPGVMSDGTPEYIKQRQGKRGEFRYF